MSKRRRSFASDRQGFDSEMYVDSDISVEKDKTNIGGFDNPIH